MKKLGYALSASILLITGCNAEFASDPQQSAVSQTSYGTAPATASLNLYDASTGNLVYSDAGGASSINLVGGKKYNVQVNVVNAKNSQVQITATNSSVPALAFTPTVINGSAGQFQAVAGQYNLQVRVTSGSTPLVSKSYTGAASCPNPNLNFTQSSLSGAGLAVSGSNNLYSYSAAAVVANANGQSPYQCAYDLTGVGIVDTAFTDCTKPLTNQYSNFLGSRNVGVVVVDACGNAQTVSHAVNFAGSTPALGQGNVFIAGQVSNESGTAAGDVRIKGVDYLATNTGGYNIVQPFYSGSSFKIQSLLNYGQPSSVLFGMEIDVSGLAGSFNLSSNPSGTIDTSNAKVNKIIFKTDQAGDQNPSVSLTGSNCTSSISAQVKNPVGQPCAAGLTGDANKADVEVWGTYTCTNVSDAGGSVSITGSFDGLVHMADSCIGGGGGGGGGIVPIQL